MVAWKDSKRNSSSGISMVYQLDSVRMLQITKMYY